MFLSLPTLGALRLLAPVFSWPSWYSVTIVSNALTPPPESGAVSVWTSKSMRESSQKLDCIPYTHIGGWSSIFVGIHIFIYPILMIPMAADDHIPDTKNRTWPLATCAKHVTWPEVWPQNEIPKTQQSSHWSCPKLGYHGYHQIPWFWKSLSRLPSFSHKPSHRRMIPASPNFLAKQNYSSSPPPPPPSPPSSSSSPPWFGDIPMNGLGEPFTCNILVA